MWPFNSRNETGGEVLERAAPIKAEARASIEDPRIPLSSPYAFAQLFGMWNSASGVVVTPEIALGVPAIWCAVNFLSGTIASLPLLMFRDSSKGRMRAENDPLYWMLHDVVNEDFLTSYQWRKQAMNHALLYGRSFTYIEKKAGKPSALWLLNPLKVVVERTNRLRRYRYRETQDKEVVYDGAEIIDIPFMTGVDGLSTVEPMVRLRNAVGLSIALESYASKFFENGGVPPLAMQMPAGATALAARRGAINLEELIKNATEERRLILPMPDGHRLDPLGFNPENGQLILARRFQVEEVARAFSLPPMFLQSLERATYANAEQQDLHFVKHTLMAWIRLWEQELNAKLTGPRTKNTIEFSVDGLLRGDFASRMSGYATAIQNALLTPDEVRAMENREAKGDEADKLHIQGATVPLGSQSVKNAAPAPAAAPSPPQTDAVTPAGEPNT